MAEYVMFYIKPGQVGTNMTVLLFVRHVNDEKNGSSHQVF